MEQNLDKNICLIMLGQDASLLNSGSESMDRTIVYAEHFSRVYAYVFAKKILQRKLTAKNVFTVGFSSAGEALLGFFQILKTVKDTQKKGFHVVITTQDPFEIGLIGLMISWVTNISLHVQVHTDISSRHMQRETMRTYMQYLLSTFVIPRAKRVRVVSQRIQNFCIQTLGIKKEKIDLVPMFYKRNVRKNVSQQLLQPCIIVLPARFVWFKRITIALEAFSYLVQKNKNVRLHIVGDGPLKKEIEQRVFALQMSNYVQMIPWMNPEDIYQNASLTLISSIYEGWCRVAVESVEAGVPVIMTDVGCAHEFIKDGKNGLIVPVEDPAALANAMEKILEDNTRYTRFREACIDTGLTIDSFDTYQRKVVSSWSTSISR